MQPAHPGDASYAPPRRRCANATSRSPRTATERSTPTRSPSRRAHPRPPLRARLGRTTGVGSPRLSAEELDADRGIRARRRRPGRHGGDRAGEVRQQPRRAPWPASSCISRTTPSGLRALPRRAELDPGRARARPRAAARVTAGPGARGLPVSLHDDHLAKRGRCARAHARHGVDSLCAAHRHRPGRRRAHRRVADSTCRRRLPRRARPPQAVAQPPLLGAGRGAASSTPRRGGAGADALADPAWTRCATDQCARRPPERRRIAGRRRPTAARATSRRSPRHRNRWPRTPHQSEYLRLTVEDCAAGRRPAWAAGLHRLAGGLPARARAPRRRLPSRLLPDVQANGPRDSVFEALIIRDAVAGLRG